MRIFFFKSGGVVRKSRAAFLHRDPFFNENSSRWVFSPFWVGFFLVLFFGFIAHIVLPFFFPALFVDGVILVLRDPHTFHQIALEYKDLPWNEFDFTPKGQFPSGILLFLYKVTGFARPIVLLPILGVLAGLTIRGIASCLDVLGVDGRWWPLLIGLLFTVTPTSFSWMVYPHKDAFIVPGVILIVWSIMSATLRGVNFRHYLSLFVGSLLVFSNKTYFAELFLVGVILCLPLILFDRLTHNRIRKFSFLVVAILLFGSVDYYRRGYTNAGKFRSKKQSEVISKGVKLSRHMDTRKNWIGLEDLEILDRPFKAMSYIRERFLDKRSHGNTNYHPEIHIKSTKDAIAYIPRAFQLSLLEPLPWRKGESGDLFRELLLTLVKSEMFFVYISIVFLISSGRKNFNPAVLTCLALAIPFIFVLGFAVPNIGSVNRYRFPFLILIKMAGLAALWNSTRYKWPGRLLMWIDPPEMNRAKKKLLFLVPDDDTFVIQRLVMAQAAQKAGFEVHVACPDLGHTQKIKDLGFIHHDIDLNRGGLNPIADFSAFIKLTFFLARLRPDILHNVSIKPVIYGATAGTIVGLNRIVCLINGLGYAFEAKKFKGKIVLHVAKALYRNALALPGVRVIFQNPDDRDYFVENKLVDAHKTSLIRGSGVNTKKFPPTEQPHNPKPVVLYVGRLLKSKGIDDLIAAAKILKLENIDFVVKIVGQPDERNPEALSNDYLEDLHKQGIVELMGRQSDMPKFYKEADIIVLPQQNREGLPLTLLEASSSGRAIIATDVPGCREVVRDQVNGLKVPPKNPEELAKAIKLLLLNPGLRKKFGENGAEIVEKEFSAEIVQKQLISVYDSLLNDSMSLRDNYIHA